MALGSTQPLVKMSTRNIPGGKGGRCVRLTTSPPSRAECHEIWEPKPPGTLWTTPGRLRDSSSPSDCVHCERSMRTHIRRVSCRRADDTFAQVVCRAVLRSAARKVARVTAWRVELR